MDDIFIKEEEVVKNAETLAVSGVFSSVVEEGYYKALLNEYKSLLSQMKRMVKMSDLIGSRLTQQTRKTVESANTDFLTGLYNRRFFDGQFQKEWRNSLGAGTPIALLIIDIDHFKLFNDTYGHPSGDRCLQAVSSKICGYLDRPRNLTARYGGEEFVVLLPETDAEGAKGVAEAILTGVAASDINLENEVEACRVTVSIGLSVVLPEEGIAPEELIKAADKALYMAKAEGRNCVREVIFKK